MLFTRLLHALQQPFGFYTDRGEGVKFRRCICTVLAVLTAAAMLSSCEEKVTKGDKLVNEAVKLYEDGDYSSALNSLTEAELEELKSVSADTLFFYMGESYFKTGDYEKSLEAHLKAVELRPDLFKSYVTIGVCYSKLGDKKEALKAYSKALEYDPLNGDSVGLYVSLGAIYISNGKPFTAIEYLESAASIYPEHAAAHAYLAMAYAMAYEKEKSQQELEIAEALGYTKIEEVKEKIGRLGR